MTELDHTPDPSRPQVDPRPKAGDGGRALAPKEEASELLRQEKVDRVAAEHAARQLWLFEGEQ